MSQEQPVDVSKFDPSWNPTLSSDGTKKTVAGPNDFIDAYYISYRENQGKDKDMTFHTVQLKDGKRWSVLGSHVLNDLLMSKITPGEYIRIQWLGIMQPKSKGGRPYNGWKVLRFEETPPLDAIKLKRSTEAVSMNNQEQEQSANTQAGGEGKKYDSLPTDDLPF